MKRLPAPAALMLLCLPSAFAAPRPVKGRSAEVMIYGDRVSFFFSMKEAAPKSFEKQVVYQRWQLSCKRSGDCSGLTIYKLSDGGAGAACSISQDQLIGARYRTVKLDLAAGEAAVEIDEPLMGKGELRIRFDPKSLGIRSAEIDFIVKAATAEELAADPMAPDQEEIRKFRLPAKSSVVRPSCVFLEEGAEPLP